MVWATLNREQLLDEQARKRTAAFLSQYAEEKGIYMMINYVNAEHAHALIDLPVHLAIQEAAHLLKGASSHWINENHVGGKRFAWQRGYGAFSVSHSSSDLVARYISKQGEHHKLNAFEEELHYLVRHHGLRWYGDD